MRRASFCEPLEPRVLLAADPVLSEFMALNTQTIQDADGQFSDWIELRNNGDQPADLTGFYLTNDPADLTLWPLPAMTLAAGESTVIFASGKDRGGAELHTNFTMDELGGYLALLQPNGSTVVSEFADYPSLARDQAYGTYRPSGDLPLTDGSDVRVFVPGDSSLGKTWTGGDEPFDDAGWTHGSAPVGFDLNEGSSAFDVDVFYSTGTISNLAGAELAISGSNLTPNSPYAEQAQVINYLDTGEGGNFSDDRSFPGSSPADDNNFVMRARSTFSLTGEQAGVWTFGFNSDDGGRLRIDGRDLIVDDTNHGPTDRFGVIDLAAGAHTLEYVMWEQGGGAEAELFAAPGNKSFFDNTFTLVGDPQGNLPLATLSGNITTDIRSDMHGKNASAYLRFPFRIDDPSLIQSMTLNIEYDDGAVIYLNGRELALLNAPVNPGHDAAAVADAGLLSSVIDVTSSIRRLRTGENILAVHGLNSSADDDEFFVDIQLSARGLLDPVMGTIDLPTPGELNGLVPPVITEFLASNRDSIRDEDGDSSDWIEIHNPGVVDFDLTDWHLTDDPVNLDRWRFPSTNLPAGDYMIVFASGKDRDDFGQPFHTDFQLDAGGGYLALVEPDGVTTRWEYNPGGEDYSPQFQDVSFGLRGTESAGGVLDPVEGLVAYWTFEEGSGNTSADVSGSGFDATLNNMDASSWVSGRKAGTTAIAFDGENDFVTTEATATDLGFPGGTPRTVAGWVQGPPFLDGTNGGVFEIGQGTNSHFALRNVRPLGSTWALEYGGEDNLTSGGAAAGSWFHVAVSYDGASVRMYINGTERQEEAVIGLTTDDLKPFTMGTFTNSLFLGSIDEIAVWDLALPAESIAALANETLTPFTVPTVNRRIGTGQGGFEVRQVNASPAFPGIVVGQIGGNAGGGADPLADSDKLLSLPPGDPGIAEEITFSFPLIDFYDTAGGGSTGLFSVDEAFPFDDFLANDDHFVLRTSATLVVPEGAEGDFVFAVHSDDGSRLRINGGDIIVDNAIHAAETRQSDVVTLAAGEHELELVYFERTGGATVELMYASVTDGELDADLQLLGVLPEFAAPAAPPNVLTADRVFFSTPTPAAPNGDGAQIFVGPTEFSHARGYYDQSFQLELSNETPGVEIYYTTDGSEPTPENPDARLYTDPIGIARTTVVRAASFLETATPSAPTTATYLFIDDILVQSPNGQTPAGFPSSWGQNARDYGMDPQIVNSGTWGPLMEQALTQIPTMSVVMDVDDLFGSRGIYSHAASRGRSWERETSLELIDPNGNEDGFQIDAGIRIRGGFSRSNDNPKHAFRFYFRSEYGESKLNYELFGDEGADEFDKIDLRTTQNYSWAFQGNTRNTFLRDIFSRDLQGAMGQPYKRGEFYHLYINGQYWGLFQTDERPEAQYAETYFGGDSEDYDVVHNNPRDNGFNDGNGDAYRRLWEEFVKPNGLSDVNMADYYRVQGMNPDGTRNPNYERLLDVDNVIDYMIITYYTSDADGPGSKFTRPGLNNYFGIYNRENPDGWKFFEHDSEHSLDTGNAAGANYNMVTPFVNNGRDFNRFNPHWMHEQLAETNSDYRQRFIDRVTEVFAEDGLLGETNVKRMLNERASEIDLAIIAESARWGDAKRASPYTKNDWNTAVNRTLAWVEGRTDVVLDQFRGVEWYPKFGEPEIQPDGGAVAEGTLVTVDFSLEQSVEDRTLSSSRSIARFIVPDAALDAQIGDTWRDEDFRTFTGWTLGSGDYGYETESGYEDIIRRSLPPGTTNLYVRPFSGFRMDDENNNGEITDEFDQLIFRMRYDDGFIAYLNGEIIVSRNAPENPTYNSLATESREATEEFEEIILGPEVISLLKPANNFLTVHAFNDSPDSSDFLVGYELIARKIFGAPGGPDGVYYTLDGSDPRLSGGRVNPNATQSDGEPFAIAENTFVRARSFVDGEWSPITVAAFQVEAPTLAITEINYHPSDPTLAERAVMPQLNGDDFEFIELQNNGTTSINLNGLKLTNGIEFEFPAVELAPAQFAVAVKNLAAFQLRYGDQVNVLGQFQSGSLANAGERIELTDLLDQPLISFGYDDAEPWPQRADGVGGTLVLRDPATPAEQYGKAYRWRGSTEFGGSPGAASVAKLGVVVNEVLSNGDAANPLDAIELLNTLNVPVDVSGWFLSDSGSNPLKYQIPAGTIMQPGQFLVINEDQFNPNPDDQGPREFALNGTDGDDVWLVTTNQQGAINRFVDDVDFGAAAPGESFGRMDVYGGRLAPMTNLTLGSDNSAPRIGPLVISEVQYHPAEPSPAAKGLDPEITADDLEFVEIANPTGTPLELKDWRLRGGVNINFDSGTVIPAGGALVVLSFNPAVPENATRVAAFRAQYGLSESTPLAGGYGGQLDNDFERVQLQRAGQPPVNDPLNTPRLWEDEVIYDDVAPWPSSADGTGNSLQRRSPQAYGNQAAAWRSAIPSPGRAEFEDGLPGDFNKDGVIDIQDVDALYVQLQNPLPDSSFDLTADGNVDEADRDFMVFNVLGTTYGDADLDGVFNSTDLVKIFQIGEYEDTVDGNSTWRDGDWNADGDFTTTDIVLAFQAGGYSAAASAKVFEQNLVEVNTIGGAAAAAVDASRVVATAGGDDSKSLKLLSSSDATVSPVANHLPLEQKRDAVFQQEVDDWIADDQGVDELAFALESELGIDLRIM